MSQQDEKEIEQTPIEQSDEPLERSKSRSEHEEQEMIMDTSTSQVIKTEKEEKKEEEEEVEKPEIKKIVEEEEEEETVIAAKSQKSEVFLQESDTSIKPVNIDENQQVLQIHSDSHSLAGSQEEQNRSSIHQQPTYGLNSNVASSEVSKNQFSAGRKNFSKAPKFNIDRDELELISQGQALSKEEIWLKLEEKRFHQLKEAAANLQGDMLFKNRCPRCTLVVPCKHFNSPQELLERADEIVYQEPNLKLMSPRKKEEIQKALKEKHQTQSMLQKAGATQLQESQMFDNQNGLNYSGSQPTDNVQTPPNLQQQVIKRKRRKSPQEQAVDRLYQPQTKRNVMKGSYSTQRSPLGHMRFSHHGSNIMNITRTSPKLQQQQNDYQYRIRDRVGGYGQLYQDGAHNRSVGSQKGSPNRLMPHQNKILLQRQQQKLAQLPKIKSYSEKEREEIAGRLAKYREEKIKTQIDQLERERIRLEQEKIVQAEKEKQRYLYQQKKKEQLKDYERIRQEKEEEKRNKELYEKEVQQYREKMKRSYHDQQKDMISEYKIMKLKTDELLQISPNFPAGRRKQQQQIINHFPLPPEEEEAQAVKEESERTESASNQPKPLSEKTGLESQQEEPSSQLPDENKEVEVRDEQLQE